MGESYKHNRRVGHGFWRGATARIWLFFGAIILLAVGCAAQVFAFTTISPPFTGAADFETGFPDCPIGPLTFGPLGVLFDGAHFFADDGCNAIMYKFGPSGGDASAPEVQSLNGLTHALTIKGGIYYGASSVPLIPNVFPGPGIYRFDPTTLDNLGPATIDFPQFASSPPFPADFPNAVLQVVGDPLSSDLYVSAFSGIYRVQNPSSISPTVTQVSATLVDGMAFTADGTILYAALLGTHTAIGFDRTFSSPVFAVDVGHPVDGIAVALNNTTLGGVNVSNNVFVNTNDGDIIRIDVNNGNAVSVVAGGGSRGDFATVGVDNCLYVTQSDRVEKMSPCFFQVTIANKCPLAPGAWKNNPAVWPVTSLQLGSQTYGQTQLEAILKTRSTGDASLILADQLIATKLSIAGDSNPGPIAATVADADALLAAQPGVLPYNVKPSSSTGQSMVNDADILDSYNNDTLTTSCTQ